ncbi:hypothetical protein ALC57_00170 [Trachymyrmex cornetzi]|uniref:Uncharacterized protein n=1 Tax=Trachymyrmex cornetzi TaxID=471704 RepID=A0A151K326_9HYME|nr:hypothetical protein ALC57_00170 [Trachymyrmex cornetzi]
MTSIILCYQRFRLLRNKMKIAVKKAKSDYYIGLVLGPVLFSLYLSDFSRTLRNCRYNFYAYDFIYLDCEPSKLVETGEIHLDTLQLDTLILDTLQMDTLYWTRIIWTR